MDSKNGYVRAQRPVATSLPQNSTTKSSVSLTRKFGVYRIDSTQMFPEADQETSEKNEPTIPDLFKGKCVLVTGATGFVGKVLVEKLLRSCPGIKEILILLRPSKKGDFLLRFQEYTENEVFKRLRSEQPDALKKLRALLGDVRLPNLGLCGWHLHKVITDVSFVFNCAANVRFDDEAKATLTTNLLGVHNVVNLCRSCKRLQVLVHVSTAYSFCNQPVIFEKIYPESVKPRHIIETTMWMTEDQLKALCVHYVHDRPALYHFSKALAETLIVESELNFPAIIVRPSIVTASMKEPFPGWIDNYNGPSGFISVCGKGIVRTLLVDPDVKADWVPVDIVVNTLIVAAHYIVVTSKSESPVMKLSTVGEVPILNCTCPENNSITWMRIVKICLPFLRKYPSMDIYGKPGGIVTRFTFIYSLCKLFSHYLPALIIDGFSCLAFESPTLVRLYNRIHRVMSYLEYYTTHPFSFDSSNMRILVEQMEPGDREVFHIDQSVLDWNQYIENYVLGVRRYFAKEKDDTLPDARKRMMRMHYAWLIVKVSSCFGVYMLFRFLHKRGHFNSVLLASLLSTNPFTRKYTEAL